MRQTAVSDAGPLIHLAEIDSLALLSTVGELCIPATVYEELELGGVPEGLSEITYELVDADTVHETDGDLDRGERAALAVAVERDAILLTDDLAAREAAVDAGVEVHGSLGVLARGYAREAIDRDDAAARMRALQRETSLFVTDAVVERGIELLDED